MLNQHILCEKRIKFMLCNFHFCIVTLQKGGLLPSYTNSRFNLQINSLNKMKKYALFLLIPIAISCSKEKSENFSKDIFSENKKIIDTEYQRLSDAKNKTNKLQTNSINSINFEYRDYVMDTYGNEGGIFYDNITKNITNEIIIPNDLQFLDSQSPQEISQSINSEYRQITNFDDILQSQNVSIAMKNKLNELRTNLLVISENKFNDAIYNNDVSILNNENVYIENLENEVAQKLNIFNLSLGTNFSLTPLEQNQLLMSSYLAQESLNNTGSLINYFDSLQNNVQVMASSKAVNGFFKSVLNVLKTIAKVVLVVVVSVAIVLAVVAAGAVLGALTGAVLVTGGVAVASGATAGAIFGGLIGAHYIASDRYQNSRLLNWMIDL